MNKETELYYHLQLAHDLILFMMHLQTDGLSQEQKARRTNMIIESWNKRVESNLGSLNRQNIKKLTEIPGINDSEDVLSIISGIHAIEITEIRKAFKELTRNNILKSYEVK
jgi:hypothetical protein